MGSTHVLHALYDAADDGCRFCEGNPAVNLHGAWQAENKHTGIPRGSGPHQAFIHYRYPSHGIPVLTECLYPLSLNLPCFVGSNVSAMKRVTTLTSSTSKEASAGGRDAACGTDVSRDKDRMRSLRPLLHRWGNCIATIAIGRWPSPVPRLDPLRVWKAMVPADW